MTKLNLVMLWGALLMLFTANAHGQDLQIAY